MQNTNITPFAFEDNLVRTYMDDEGNPWFVAKDVCKVLGLDNNRKAIENLDDDERADVTISDTSSSSRNSITMNAISESGMYSLVFRSRKPEAKKFSKWVRAEVLPTLRKTGYYGGALPKGEDTHNYSKYIKPAVRLQLLMTAQRVVNMSGNGQPETVEGLFYHYCQLITEGFVGSVDSRQSPYTYQENLVERFVSDCLEPCPHGRITAKQLHNALARWWKSFDTNPAPSPKIVGMVMRKYYRAQKSNGIVYMDVRFVDGIN